MKVYELTIRIASAYEDIEDVLCSDELTEAVRKGIAENDGSGHYPRNLIDYTVELPASPEQIRVRYASEDRGGAADEGDGK